MGTFLLADGPGCGHFVCFYLMAFSVWVRDRCRGSMRMHTYTEDTILRVLQLILRSGLNELRASHLTPLQLASGGQGFKVLGPFVHKRTFRKQHLHPQTTQHKIHCTPVHPLSS